jgi:hypothetical protein
LAVLAHPAVDAELIELHMADELTFTDVVDWLADRQGRGVYVEVGMRDPTMDHNDAIVLAAHVQLGNIGDGIDVSHERGIVYLPLAGIDSDRNRVYLDRQRITEIQIDGPALRLFFHDSFYIAFSGG